MFNVKNQCFSLPNQVFLRKNRYPECQNPPALARDLTDLLLDCRHLEGHLHEVFPQRGLLRWDVHLRRAAAAAGQPTCGSGSTRNVRFSDPRGVLPRFGEVVSVASKYCKIIESCNDLINFTVLLLTNF